MTSKSPKEGFNDIKIAVEKIKDKIDEEDYLNILNEIKEAQKNNNAIKIENLFTETYSNFKSIARELKKLFKKQEVLASKIEIDHNKIIGFDKKLTTLLENIDEILINFSQKMELMEETFLVLYSNIKRNQFIYAHYPEEWNETFLEFKETLKKENKEFENVVNML